MPIDFTLTMEQKRLQADARAFARDVLTKVGPATRGLPTPLARFAAGERRRAGLVLGYGAIATARIEEGLSRLRRCFT